MKSPRILIAGVGNVFLGDDAFGVEVIRCLQNRALPAYVTLRDFGIRGLDLGYALVEPYDLILLVDVIRRGEAPGTLYVLEPTLAESSVTSSIPTHGMVPTRAFEFARTMGASFNQVRIIGCEPGNLESTDQISDLTPPVRQAVQETADLLEELVDEFVSATLYA